MLVLLLLEFGEAGGGVEDAGDGFLGGRGLGREAEVTDAIRARRSHPRRRRRLVQRERSELPLGGLRLPLRCFGGDALRLGLGEDFEQSHFLFLSGVFVLLSRLL